MFALCHADGLRLNMHRVVLWYINARFTLWFGINRRLDTVSIEVDGTGWGAIADA
ncbi:Uncharacterised protein [Vibrio cholerae]|nr:Uncharacterised protein [Vibrio cholerae]